MGDPNDAVAGSRVRRARWAAARTATTWLLAVLLCAVACAPKVKVESRVLSPATDFAALRSFAIVPTADANGNVNRGVEEAIRLELVERGLTPMDIDRADMVIVYRASAVDQVKRQLDGDPDANFYRIVEYVEGTLVIDVYDRAEAHRIWHGQAVLDDRDRAELDRRKRAAVDQILEGLPVGR